MYAGARRRTLPLTSALIIFLVFALTILAAGETRAFLVVFGFGRNLAAVFMTARTELVATLVVATNLISSSSRSYREQ